MSATRLYTADILGLATGLARYPWNPDFPLQAEARSKACGSAIRLGLLLDTDGAIETVAVRSQACAIGQAAAAIFADAAKGMTGAQIHDAGSAIARWLRDEAEMPGWPGLDAIATARDYPARHGALMLPWNAAMQLLPSR
jgi:NifU-like protein involved in Fe-S cluster formation